MTSEQARPEYVNQTPFEDGDVFELHRSDLISLEEARARRLADEALWSQAAEKVRSFEEGQVNYIVAASANIAAVRRDTLGDDTRRAA